MNIAVHAYHCCKWHGCKYGDDDTCPVVNGYVKQLYLCEWCYEDIENEELHRQVLKNIEEMKEFCSGELNNE